MKQILFLFILLGITSCKKKEDLSSFDIQNIKIEESIESFSNKNDALLNIIFINADKNYELVPIKETAARAFEVSKILYDYLEELKTVIKEKNTTEFVDELFFNGLDITNEGNEFIQYIEIYKSDLIATVETAYPEIAAMVKNNFDIGSIENRRGQQTNWLTLNYKGFPPISTIIKLSIMQSDIKRVERKLYSSILGVKLRKSTSNKGIVDKNVTDNKDVITKNIDSITSSKKEVKEIKKGIDVVVKKEPKKEVIAKKETDKKYHIVAVKETVYRISLNYGITPNKLKKLNGMTNNNLVVGQKLRVQ